MSDWKTEIEEERDVKIFFAGKTSDLSDNDKGIILDLIDQLEKEESGELLDSIENAANNPISRLHKINTSLLIGKPLIKREFLKTTSETKADEILNSELEFRRNLAVEIREIIDSLQVRGKTNE